MELPDLDELEWLEIQQQEEDYPVELQEEGEDEEESIDEGKYKNEAKRCDTEESLYSDSHQQFHSQIPSNEKKRPRSDDDDCARVRVRVPNHDNDNFLFRYASDIDGDYVPVTSPSGSGERIYAKIDDKNISFGDSNVNKFTMPPNFSGIISESVCLLLQKAEQDALMKALQDSSEVQNPLSPSDTSIMTEELWVNKYAPRSFTELLSDELTNREVLSWFKQWDASVFGNDIRDTEEEVLCALRRHSSIPHHQKRSSANFPGKSRGPKPFGKYMENSFSSELEKNTLNSIDVSQTKMQSVLGTPDQKVLLLCGSPGLGKTTLAHVAAKHCGYHVVEINASDDRSSTSIETKILDAVQMNSVMDYSKPKCLVIDEIDGALGDGKGAVEVLLKMVAAEKKFCMGIERSTEGQKKSLNKGRKSVSLSRPVICICNDLYAPSLRSLRHVAKVHAFAKPTVNRVVSRLKYICKREGMRIGSIALAALAEYTECDVRSCLNTLQFLHKKKESLNLVALSSQVIGRKDLTRSVFDVWKEVFQKRKIKQSHKCDVDLRKTYDSHDSLFSLVSNRGDYDLIFDGIHENFLQIPYHDPLLQKTVHCLNALGVSDLLHHCVTRSHNMSLSVYYSFITITIHLLLARVESQPIEWPKSFQRYRSLLTERMECLRSWQSKIVPCVSRHLSLNSFVEDTVSPLLHILSPSDLRPVAVHLLSEKEKNDLAQLINTMVSLSLTYKSTNSNKVMNDDMMDSSPLNLDPPIQDFMTFKGCKPGHCELSSAVKKILVYEVEKHKIVQESLSKFRHSTDNSKRELNAAKNQHNGTSEPSKVHEAACVYYNKDKMTDVSPKDILLPNVNRFTSSPGFGGTPADAMKRKFTANVKKPSAGSMNFFGRFKKSSHNVDSTEEKLSRVDKEVHNLLFKFNEGFTNAVKKPVRVREFLL
ncbi:unnamed protein product [Amaranthus hypochondriacus]